MSACKLGFLKKFQKKQKEGGCIIFLDKRYHFVRGIVTGHAGKTAAKTEMMSVSFGVSLGFF